MVDSLCALGLTLDVDAVTMAVPTLSAVRESVPVAWIDVGADFGAFTAGVGTLTLADEGVVAEPAAAALAPDWVLADVVDAAFCGGGVVLPPPVVVVAGAAGPEVEELPSTGRAPDVVLAGATWEPLDVEVSAAAGRLLAVVDDAGSGSELPGEVELTEGSGTPRLVGEVVAVVSVCPGVVGVDGGRIGGVVVVGKMDERTDEIAESRAMLLDETNGGGTSSELVVGTTGGTTGIDEFEKP